jgi:type III pantothenate kinase
MILCLDVGNTQIHGGVFSEGKLALQFRKTSRQQFSSDEVGIFLKSVLRENGIDPTEIKEISICTVVPDILHSLRNGCLKYFEIEPFVLKAGVKTGLKIKYRNPLEVGTDRIANAIAGVELFPNKNLIIVDFGTATTFDVVNKNKEYLGGAIIPGVKLSMESLVSGTSKLSSIEITEVKEAVGRSTSESIQSGLYFGSIGMIKELTQRITKEIFHDDPPLVIATGGFSRLFENTKLFNEIKPNLVLRGLNYALNLNRKK